MNNLKIISIKKSSTIFLQFVVVTQGIVTFALLLWEPQIEGVAAHSTNFELYFNPFILLVYTGSIPFFAALFQTFKILRYAADNNIISPETVKAIRTIKYCAITIIGFVVLEVIFILLNHGDDDATGGVFIGLLIFAGSGIIASIARMFEKTLQSAVDIKSENDLTV